MTRPSPTMLRVLRTISRGKEEQFRMARIGLGSVVLLGLAVEQGYARTVKHRDATRSYKLTPAGKAALAAPDVEARLQADRFEHAARIAKVSP